MERRNTTVLVARDGWKSDAAAHLRSEIRRACRVAPAVQHSRQEHCYGKRHPLRESRSGDFGHREVRNHLDSSSLRARDIVNPHQPSFMPSDPPVADRHGVCTVVTRMGTTRACCWSRGEPANTRTVLVLVETLNMADGSSGSLRRSLLG